LRRLALVLIATGALWLPATAGAATQLGETFASENGGDPGATHLQSSSPGDQYTAGFRGVITSWSHLAATPPGQVKLKVARSLGGDSFLIVGESAAIAPPAGALITIPAQIPVEPGDVIGNYTSGQFYGRSTSNPAYRMRYLYPGDPPAGSTNTYPPAVQYQVNIAATLEPDCDNDGFGDESQDQNLDACPPGPIATITTGPPQKVKSKKNRTKATFTFTADEPDATFNCALDGQQQFEPCVSPVTVTVRKGEHSFSVTATDTGGNQGAPATDTWKVKRKKKKKK
jgi:hypothetical protein